MDSVAAMAEVGHLILRDSNVKLNEAMVGAEAEDGLCHHMFITLTICYTL